MFLRSKIAPLLLVTASVVLLLALAGLDRYLFARRIAQTDPKYFYSEVQELVRRMQTSGDTTSGAYVPTKPETQSYRVVVANDRLIVFYTCSYTSSAYLIFSRSGDAWAVAWLRGNTFSPVGTFRF